MTEEIWKAVPGYEGKYEASTLGHVREARTGDLITPNKQGLKVELELNRVESLIPLQKVVATTFLPNPFMYAYVQNIDGNTENNAVSNLMWTDGARNQKYKRINEAIKVIDNEGNEKFVIYSLSSLAQRLGVSVAYLSIHYLESTLLGIPLNDFRRQITSDHYFMLQDDYEMLMDNGRRIYSTFRMVKESLIDKAYDIAGDDGVVKGKNNIKRLIDSLSESELDMLKFELMVSPVKRKFNAKLHISKTDIQKQITFEDTEKFRIEYGDKIAPRKNALNKAIQKYTDKADKSEREYNDYIDSITAEFDAKQHSNKTVA